MTGEDFKTEGDEAYQKYVSDPDSAMINDSEDTPPKDAASKEHKTGIKAFLHDFGLDKSMNPLTLLKIYGNF